MRLGILDIGSNTVHLLVVDASAHGRPDPAADERTTVRLMQYLSDDGSINPDGVKALTESVEQAVKAAKKFKADQLIGMATSAIREAKNGAEVLADLEKIAGVPISVLTGQQEAELTFLAARRWHGWAAGRLLVLDIGGGSLEVAHGRNELPDEALSVPLGAGRLTRDFLPHDPPTPKECKALTKHVRKTLKPLKASLKKVTPDHVVATSKTFRSLARLSGQLVSVVGPEERRRMSRHDLADWVDRLGRIPAAQRMELPGITPERCVQIYAGAVVAYETMKALGVDEVEICPWALREGAILQFIDPLLENY